MVMQSPLYRKCYYYMTHPASADLLASTMYADPFISWPYSLPAPWKKVYLAYPDSTEDTVRERHCAGNPVRGKERGIDAASGAAREWNPIDKTEESMAGGPKTNASQSTHCGHGYQYHLWHVVHKVSWTSRVPGYYHHFQRWQERDVQEGQATYR